MAIDIGELLVRIRADTQQLTSGLTRARQLIQNTVSAIDRMGGRLKKFGVQMATLSAGAVLGFKKAMDSVFEFNKEAQAQFEDMIGSVMPMWLEFLDDIVVFALPVVGKFVETVVKPLLEAWTSLDSTKKQNIIESITKLVLVMATLGPIIVAVGTAIKALAFFLTPLGAITGLISAMAALFIISGGDAKKMGEIITDVFEGIGQVLGFVIPRIITFLNQMFETIVAWAATVEWNKVWDKLFDFTTDVATGVITLAFKILNKLIEWAKTADWLSIWNRMADAVLKIGDTIKLNLETFDWGGFGKSVGKIFWSLFVSELPKALIKLPYKIGQGIGNAILESGQEIGTNERKREARLKLWTKHLRENVGVPPADLFKMMQRNEIMIPDWFEPELMARGGIVRSPTLAMIGEAGPEAVIPLSQIGAMGGTVVINVSAPSIDERNRRELFQEWMDMAERQFNRSFGVK